MDVDRNLAAVAAAIGEPARARMLGCLLGGRARTATELAVIAGVAASTASVHLQRLRQRRLVTVLAQGKHRYYSLAGAEVAAALEALQVVAGAGERFAPSTPRGLRAARTCYDHLAGALGVELCERLQALGWLRPARQAEFKLTTAGGVGLAALGVDVVVAVARRRRLAYACLDWSERRPHLGGALGAALLDAFLQRQWLLREPEGRALTLTRAGGVALAKRYGLAWKP